MATRSTAAVIVRGRAETLQVMGSTVELHLGAKHTAGEMMSAVVDAGPEMQVPAHIHHRETEIFHVLDGFVEVDLDGRTQVVGPGDTALLPRGVPHAWRAHRGPARIHLTTIPAGMEDYFRAIADRPGEPAKTAEEVIALSAEYGIEFCRAEMDAG